MTLSVLDPLGNAIRPALEPLPAGECGLADPQRAMVLLASDLIEKGRDQGRAFAIVAGGGPSLERVLAKR